MADVEEAERPHELRCPGRLYGVITDEGLIEVKCRSYKCGASPEVVVFHYFDPETQEITKTKKFQDAKVLFDRTNPKEKEKQ